MDHAVFGGYREELAPGLEDGPLAAGRDVGSLDEIGGVDPSRPQTGEVGDDLHLDLGVLLVVEPHQIEPATGLKDHVGRADGGKGDVEVGEVRDLTHLSGRRIEGPDVGAQGGAAVGEKVESVTVPHRVGVVGGALSEIARVQGFEIEEPDVWCAAAPVALPGAEAAVLRGVGDHVALGGEGAELTVRHGKPLG